MTRPILLATLALCALNACRDPAMTNDQIIYEVHKCEAAGLTSRMYFNGFGTGFYVVCEARSPCKN